MLKWEKEDEADRDEGEAGPEFRRNTVPLKMRYQ